MKFSIRLDVHALRIPCILIVALVPLLAGCGGGSNDNGSGNGSASTNGGGSGSNANADSRYGFAEDFDQYFEVERAELAAMAADGLVREDAARLEVLPPLFHAAGQLRGLLRHRTVDPYIARQRALELQGVGAEPREHRARQLLPLRDRIQRQLRLERTLAPGLAALRVGEVLADRVRHLAGVEVADGQGLPVARGGWR